MHQLLGELEDKAERDSGNGMANEDAGAFDQAALLPSNQVKNQKQKDRAVRQ